LYRGSRTGEDISEDVDGIQENNTTAETKTTDKAHVIEGKEAATAGYELVKIYLILARTMTVQTQEERGAVGGRFPWLKLRNLTLL